MPDVIVAVILSPPVCRPPAGADRCTVSSRKSIVPLAAAVQVWSL